MSQDRGTKMRSLFDDLRNGVEGSTERLFSQVYEELHRMAHGQMIHEGPGQTLQTTALVNEAYVRLVGDKEADFENRRHFLGAAAIAMRRILIDHARKKRAKVRGGNLVRVPLDDDVAGLETPIDILVLDEALKRLAIERPRHAEVVSYRYFLGCTVKETAALLDIAPRTVNMDWEFAKSWLRREIERSAENVDDSP